MNILLNQPQLTILNSWVINEMTLLNELDMEKRSNFMFLFHLLLPIQRMRQHMDSCNNLPATIEQMLLKSLHCYEVHKAFFEPSNFFDRYVLVSLILSIKFLALLEII